jgi:hypothetical protein
MNIYLRNLISEDERRRISNLHNSKIKSEFKKLLSEQDPNLVQRNDPDLSPEMNKFNEGAFNLEDFIAAAKEQVDGFPEDGYVVNIPTHGMVWGVRTKLQDGTIGVKYYLKQDGTVVGPDMTTISKNKWYTAPIQVKGDTMKTLNPTQVSSKLAGTTGTENTIGQQQKLMGGRELNDLEKQLKQQANQQRRTQKKLTKENVKKCRGTFDTYVKYFGDETRKANLIKVPQGAESFKGYTAEIESCCPIFSKDKKYLPNVQKQKFCLTSTAAGPGYDGFNADSDGNGVPDYLQANPVGATGAAKPGAAKPGVGGRLSPEDQEMRDLGLQ